MIDYLTIITVATMRPMVTVATFEYGSACPLYDHESLCKTLFSAPGKEHEPKIYSGDRSTLPVSGGELLHFPRGVLDNAL